MATAAGVAIAGVATAATGDTAAVIAATSTAGAAADSQVRPAERLPRRCTDWPIPERLLAGGDGRGGGRLHGV